MTETGIGPSPLVALLDAAAARRALAAGPDPNALGTCRRRSGKIVLAGSVVPARRCRRWANVLVLGVPVCRSCAEGMARGEDTGREG